jgi:hypothetical protein
LDILDLIIGLTGFLSFAGNVRIEDKDQKFETITTCPFILQNLLYRILCFAYESASPEGEIRLRLSPEKDKGILLTVLNSAQMPVEKFPDEKIKQTAELLGVEFKKNDSFYELNMLIPYICDKIKELEKNE